MILVADISTTFRVQKCVIAGSMSRISYVEGRQCGDGDITITAESFVRSVKCLTRELLVLNIMWDDPTLILAWVIVKATGPANVLAVPFTEHIHGGIDVGKFDDKLKAAWKLTRLPLVGKH